MPSLQLLTPPEPHQPNYTDEQLADMAELLEVRLREYGVKAEVVDTAWAGHHALRNQASRRGEGLQDQ